MNEPSVSIWILALPALAATILLYVRLAGILDRRFVLFLLGYGVAFFWLKEFLQARGWFLNHVYSFSDQAALRLAGVPLVGIAGHLFTFGLSISIGLRILRQLRLPANGPFLLAVCYGLSMAVAYMVEPGGSIAGWWYWGYGDKPWQQVPDLQWMGEVNLGLVSFQQDSIGDVPACLLAGWPVGISLFLFPIILYRTFPNSDTRWFRYAGFILVLPIMLLAEVVKPIVPAMLIGILLLGLRTDGSRALLPMNRTAPESQSGPVNWLLQYGDYLAFLIFFLVIVGVELAKGVAGLYLPTWLPLGLYLIFTKLPGKVILPIVGLICLVAVSGYFFPCPARWITPFQVVYFLAAGFMVPAFLIHQWSSRKRPMSGLPGPGR